MFGPAVPAETIPDARQVCIPRQALVRCASTDAIAPLSSSPNPTYTGEWRIIAQVIHIAMKSISFTKSKFSPP